MNEQIIALRVLELDALHGTGPLALALYLHLRAWMDYGTGISGRSRPISLAMLASYTETHITRGAGVQVAQESEKAIRVALARLTQRGLLRRLAGERLVFALPLALTAPARPKRTGRDEGTVSSTEHGTPQAAPALEDEGERGPVHAMLQWPNWAHIKYQENLNPTLPHVDNFDLPGGSRSTRKPGSAARGGGGSANCEDTNRLLRLGERVGKPPRPGESWKDYRGRLMGR
ncbi:MAG: hypothetical protein JSS57_25515 [Proteobacteria bacterium]|nr:hypothetical protein [Pseudomonadota bacterium]